MAIIQRAMTFLNRFGRANKGVAAVEFAIIAIPFILLLYAVIDTSLVYYASQTLQNGVSAAARQIKTGQAQAANMSSTQFRTLICNQISMLLKCDAHLAIDVRRFTSFSNVNLPAALDANGNLTGNFQFNMGGAGDIIVVRAFYAWPVLTPNFGQTLVNMNGNARLLTASFAFKNEPF
ncbi:MAG: pilus assembly protein [Alphaproteobacteria bacterium]|nr:pilus assembly protein [Alphaproteobacteria bacterium]